MGHNVYLKDGYEMNMVIKNNLMINVMEGNRDRVVSAFYISNP